MLSFAANDESRLPLTSMFVGGKRFFWGAFHLKSVEPFIASALSRLTQGVLKGLTLGRW